MKYLKLCIMPRKLQGTKRKRSQRSNHFVSADIIYLSVRIVGTIANGICSSWGEYVSVLDLLLELLSDSSSHGYVANCLGTLSSILRAVASWFLTNAASADPCKDVCFKFYARMLMLLGNSSALKKHSHLLVGCIVDVVSDHSLSKGIREQLIPGLFSLIESCTPRQKKSIGAVLNEKGRTCFNQIMLWYSEDFAFSTSSA